MHCSRAIVVVTVAAFCVVGVVGIGPEPDATPACRTHGIGCSDEYVKWRRDRDAKHNQRRGVRPPRRPPTMPSRAGDAEYSTTPMSHSAAPIDHDAMAANSVASPCTELTLQKKNDTVNFLRDSVKDLKSGCAERCADIAWGSTLQVFSDVRSSWIVAFCVCAALLMLYMVLLPFDTSYATITTGQVQSILSHQAFMSTYNAISYHSGCVFRAQLGKRIKLCVCVAACAFMGFLMRSLSQSTTTGNTKGWFWWLMMSVMPAFVLDWFPVGIVLFYCPGIANIVASLFVCWRDLTRQADGTVQLRKLQVLLRQLSASAYTSASCTVQKVLSITQGS
jgi:hypothetical protein